MKKFLRFIAIFFFAFYIVGVDSQAEEDEFADWDVPGVYPISVYDEAWADMTFAEQLEAVALPEELVDSLSTQELADWVLAYPFLGDLLMFDSPKASMDYFSRTSYLFRSFFAREDVIEVLLSKYDDLQVDYEMLVDENAGSRDAFTESGYFKELFLQTYFYTVLNELSVEEKTVLKDIVEEKYNEKLGICDDFTTATLLYGDVLKKYGEIPEELILPADTSSGEAEEEREISEPNGKRKSPLRRKFYPPS